MITVFVGWFLKDSFFFHEAITSWQECFCFLASQTNIGTVRYLASKLVSHTFQSLQDSGSQQNPCCYELTNIIDPFGINWTCGKKEANTYATVNLQRLRFAANLGTWPCCVFFRFGDRERHACSGKLNITSLKIVPKTKLTGSKLPSQL